MRRARECSTSSHHGKGFFIAPNGGNTASRRRGMDWRRRPGSRGGTVVMEKNENYMKALKCRECGREYPLTATHVCEFDFGPLEVVYDYERIRKALTHEAVQSRARSMW